MPAGASARRGRPTGASTGGLKRSGAAAAGDREPARGAARPPAGLCDLCRHQRLVGTTRGSEFSLCERSRTDAAYPRYPRVPVRACPGFERSEAEGRGA